MITRTNDHSGLVALHRFGLGARGGDSGDLCSAALDPRGYLAAELARPGGALLDIPTLHPTSENLQTLYQLQEQVRLARQVEPKEQVSKEQMNATPSRPPDAIFLQQTFRAETLARWQRQFSADAGFVERLVAFWSNHFCISALKDGFVRAIAGAFEREAIRPHVLGRFADMLLAVEQHPAMLRFLDNMQSFGPNSRAGLNQKRGLNENLAREILELHTLGINGGYSQEDVTSLASIITGWTVVGPQAQLGPPGTFAFFQNAHEPGDHSVLGKTYKADGVEQGRRALTDIARSPSTAKFITTKFARHFVSDDPPKGLVARLASVFTRTDGDLKALSLALINDDEAWNAPFTKMRTPHEFLIAVTRLIGRTPEDPGRINGGAALLGQPIWQPAGPNGFSDASAHWASAEGIKLRLEISSDVANRLGDAMNAVDLAEVAFGGAMSQDTRTTIGRAESKQQALSLLLMSPEFQRR